MVQWLRLGFPMQGVWVRSLVSELRPHVAKNENRCNIVTDSVKTLKMVHIKKKKNLFKRKSESKLHDENFWLVITKTSEE